MIATIRAMNPHTSYNGSDSSTLTANNQNRLKPNNGKDTGDDNPNKRSHNEASRSEYRTPTSDVRRIFSIAQERSRRIGDQLSNVAVALGRNGSRLQAQDSFRSRRDCGGHSCR